MSRMSKVKEIVVSMKFKKNLGNYQTVDIEAGITMEIEDGDDYKEAYEQAWLEVRSQVQGQLKSGEPK